MGKLGKALLHSSLLLVVLAVVAVLYLDGIVGTAVEEGGSRALGVPTEVGSVSLGRLSGKVALGGLSVANPEGFSRPQFRTLGSIRIAAPPRTLLGDPVEIPSITLEDLELWLEGSPQGTNYGRLLRNVASATGSGSASDAIHDIYTSTQRPTTPVLEWLECCMSPAGVGRLYGPAASGCHQMGCANSPVRHFGGWLRHWLIVRGTDSVRRRYWDRVFASLDCRGA